MKFRAGWLRRWIRGAGPRPAPPIQAAVVAALGPFSVLALNVGARWGDSGAWWRIDPLMRVVGFEPDAAECGRLNALCANPAHERYVPMALGASAQDAVLHLTRDPACSSLYAPLESLGGRYPELTSIQAIDRLPVRLAPLDAWWADEGRPIVDFIKLDTQGSELDILRGAEGLLSACVGLEVEVEFSPLYQQQPLFVDVDSFLRERGFVLWRFRDLCHYSEAPYKPGELGRLYWANAVYLRDYRSLGSGAADLRRQWILAALLEALDDIPTAQACLASARRDPSGRTDTAPAAPTAGR